MTTQAPVESPYRPTLRLTPIQVRFRELVNDASLRQIAIGGAVRGTKTWACAIVTILDLLLKYPGSRAAVVRRDLPTLRKEWVPSFEKLREYTEGWIGELYQGTWTYPCANGSTLQLWPESLEQDPEYGRWRGFETNWFILEEANELAHRTLHMAMVRAGSWIIPASPEQRHRMIEAQAQGLDPRPFGPEQPPSKILMNFNPADNWVREELYDPWEAGTLAPPKAYLKATIKDNPFMSDEQLLAYKDLPPEEYEVYVEGIWGTLRKPNQLVDPTWLTRARDVPFEPGPARLGCDPARDGPDAAVHAVIVGNALVYLSGNKRMNTEAAADECERLIGEYLIPPENVTIDTVGVGGGTADKLLARKLRVHEFMAGGKVIPRRINGPNQPALRLVPLGLGEGAPIVNPISLYKFADLRSQAYWEFREKLRLGTFRINVPASIHMQRFQKELLAHTYTTSNRVLRVDDKDKVKDELGFSPDYSDAVVMAALEWPRRGGPLIQPTSRL